MVKSEIPAKSLTVIVKSPAVCLYFKSLERLLTFELLYKAFSLLYNKIRAIGQRVEAIIFVYLDLYRFVHLMCLSSL